MCELGRGATASVFQVEHGGEKFALKSISLIGDVKPSVITREIKSLHEAMNCQFIVSLHEAYHRESHIHMLLELMDAGSLEQLYTTKNMDIPEEIVSAIAFEVGLKFVMHTVDS